jgi:hypothetical protein
MKKYYYIYKTTNNITGKIYIGKRYGTLDESYYGSGVHIKRSINHHGQSNFTKDILVITDNFYIDELERNMIQHFNSQDPSVGYNISSGGDGGDTYQGRSWKEVSNTQVYNRRVQKKKERDAVYWTDANRALLGEAVKSKQWTGSRGAKRREDHRERITGSKNPGAKSYELTDTDGNVISTSCLKSFCEDNGLVTSTVRRFVGVGKIERKSNKDHSFKNCHTKRFLNGWEIIEKTVDITA